MAGNLNSAQEMGSFAILRNFAGCENFATLQNFCSAPFCSLFALLSFWDLICNDEFNSGSLCLNWLDNFGLIIFQKLQK